jgi:DNA modification methylase
MQETLGEVNNGKEIETDDEEKMVKKRFGFLPTSVWCITKSKIWMRYVDDKLAIGSYADKDEQSLSQFNPDVAARIVKIWSKKDDLVLDPFCNRGTTVMVARALGRHSIFYEIVPKYYEHTMTKINKQTLVPFTHKIDGYLGNAANMDKIGDGSIDLIFTSPPFWNVEKYESCEGQMSDLDDYREFLQAYVKSIEECFRVLKPGKYCVFVVNDIRRNKRLIPFGSDTINCFERSGFHLHDVIINQLFGLAIMGVGQAIDNGYTPKMHEYILVFKKPEAI